MKEELKHTKKEAVISVRELYKSFGENDVLRGVALDLFRGENLVVLGKSGTGKSVLIKIISGLLKPDAGSVTVLGKEVPSLKPMLQRKYGVATETKLAQEP